MGFLNSESFFPCNESYAEIQAFNCEISHTKPSLSERSKIHTDRLTEKMSGFPMQGNRKERILKGKPANRQIQGISAFQKSSVCSFCSNFSEQPVFQALLTCAMLLMTCGSILRGNFKILNKDRETKAFSASRIFFSSTETYTANVVSATWKPEREFTVKCVVYSDILKALKPDRHLGNRSINHKTGKIPCFWPFQ